LRSQHSVKTHVIQGDGGVVADIERCVSETVSTFGGLDVIIGNAGFTKFSDFKDLNALTYEEWDKCWNTNVKGNHALLKTALPIFNKNAEGGVFIMTSSIAGKTLSGSSMAYSVTKAAQVHLMKCLANTQGPKVRINAVLPGLLLTDWGNLYGEERINGLKNASALKKEVGVAASCIPFRRRLWHI
jgi:NAD(P)-dependent dehydrogenase (short-subunit alcohol dehydrogenase family)